MTCGPQLARQGGKNFKNNSEDVLSARAHGTGALIHVVDAQTTRRAAVRCKASSLPLFTDYSIPNSIFDFITFINFVTWSLDTLYVTKMFYGAHTKDTNDENDSNDI